MDSRERQALDWLAAHRDQIQYGIDSSGILACERDSLEKGIRFNTYEQAARHFGWQGPVSEGRLQQLAQEWLNGQPGIMWWNERHWIVLARFWCPVQKRYDHQTRYASYYAAAKDLGWKGPENDPQLGRNTSTAEGRELWAEVDRAVANVASWPAWKRWPHPADPTEPCLDPLFAAHLRTLEARAQVLDLQPSPDDDEPPCNGCGGSDDDVCACFRSYEDWEMLSCGE